MNGLALAPEATHTDDGPGIGHIECEACEAVLCGDEWTETVKVCDVGCDCQVCVVCADLAVRTHCPHCGIEWVDD